MTLAKLESLNWLKKADKAPVSATALAGNMEILIPMKGLIDKNAEMVRLDKEIHKLNQEYSRIIAKLSNSGFTEKAPAAVVEKERKKLAEIEPALAILNEKLSAIESL